MKLSILLKINKIRLNETKLVFYDEIEALRLKFEHGARAAKKYQERCENINEEFQRIFIERNINFKKDFGHSWVKEFIETRNKWYETIYRDPEDSQDFTGTGEGMDQKTKALYLCIKRQLNRENHPICMINTKFAEVYSRCYKRFVDRSRIASTKLRKRLDTINQRMMSMVNETDVAQTVKVIETSDGEFSPPFREKPNYLLTRQVVGDIKIFIKIMLSMVNQYYQPVIKKSEFEIMKEDIIETLTNIIITKDVYKIVFSFFRLEFTELEKNLRDRYKEFKHITPGQWRVNEYFRLDNTSPLLKIYRDTNLN